MLFRTKKSTKYAVNVFGGKESYTSRLSDPVQRKLKLSHFYKTEY